MIRINNNQDKGPMAEDKRLRWDASDIIPVRDGEDFDHARLAAYLGGKLPDSDRRLAVGQFSGGTANLTYLLRYGDTEWKHFLDMYGAFLVINGEMERLFKTHMEKLGAA
jgi:hypothetical protein